MSGEKNCAKLVLQEKNPESKSGLKKKFAHRKFFTPPPLMARPLHGAILNFKMRITVPTSFRVALVCNFPALGSLYASRVDFETARNLICVVAVAL